MEERQHIYYFDYLRILSLCSVIFMHTASVPLRGVRNLSWMFLNLGSSLAFTAVPLFMMMSGYLLLSDEKTLNITLLFRRRLPRLVIPFAFWNIAATVWLVFRTGEFTVHAFASQLYGALSQPVMVHFWYMYTLIAIYLISPLLYSGLHGLDRKGRLLIFILIVLVSAQAMCRQLAPATLDRFFNFDIINKMQFFGSHLCTFFLGYYLGSSKRAVPNWLLVSLAILCLAGITMGTYGLTKLSGGYDQTLQDQSAGFEILLASCIFLFCKQNLNKKIPVLYRAVRPIVALSLPIYLSHNIVLSILSHYGVYATGFGDTMGISVLVLAICLAVTMATTYIRPLCYPVNGLSVAGARAACRWRVRTKQTVQQAQ